jgi:hypothetical protein
MTLDPTTMHTRVVDELSRCPDAGLADVARGWLVTPRPVFQAWDFGDDEPFSGVVVAEVPERNVGIAYSEEPFGASTPWLLVSLEPAAFRYDAYGFESLEQAVRAALA